MTGDTDLTESNPIPYLQIQGVTKIFDDNYAVDHVDLTINKHEIFALLGSSGCGKTTLLRMLAGMETPTEGKIILDGEDITRLAPYERPINMMFQSYALFPHMTVEQNIAFGLKQDKLPKDEVIAQVDKMLRLVQMSKYANRKPHQLSGGQQQRIALARSLAKRPKLLLLDEPLGALDKKLRQQTQLELVNTIETVGVTCIMVTHDQDEAMTMSTRIAVMSEGQLMQVGTPTEIYDFPTSRFTAEFIGETNIFEGEISVDEDDHVQISCTDLPVDIFINHGISGHQGQKLWVSIRPEDVRVDINKPQMVTYNYAQGVIKEIAYLGGIVIYHIALPDGKVVKAKVTASRWYQEDIEPPTWDDTVYLSWRHNLPVVLIQ